MSSGLRKYGLYRQLEKLKEHNDIDDVDKYFKILTEREENKWFKIPNEDENLSNMCKILFLNGLLKKCIRPLWKGSIYRGVIVSYSYSLNPLVDYDWLNNKLV